MISLDTRPRGRVPAWLAVVAALLFASAPPAAISQSRSRAPAPAQTPINDPPVIDSDGYRQLLAKHKGKVVLVDFWATWCEPCRDAYPMVNELAKQYGPQGLVVVGVSLDDDGEITLVRRFLERERPVFRNYRKRPGKEQEFIDSVDRKWSGAIPADFFYDTDGHQALALVGEHPRADFEKAIRTMLAAAAKPSGSASLLHSDRSAR